VYYNCNIQTEFISKKYYRRLHIWPKHTKTILIEAPDCKRLVKDVLILHC